MVAYPKPKYKSPKICRPQGVNYAEKEVHLLPDTGEMFFTVPVEMLYLYTAPYEHFSRHFFDDT